MPVQLVFLAGGEALILFFSVYAGLTLRFLGFDAGDQDASAPFFLRALVFTIVMMIIMTAFGLFTRESQIGNAAYYLRFLASYAVGVIAMSVIFYIFPGLYTGRGVLALTFAVAFISSAMFRMVFLRLVDHGTLKRRLLVLGVGTRAARIGALLDQHETLRLKYRFLGYLPMDGDGPRQRHVPRRQLLENQGSLMAVIATQSVDEVVVAIRDRRASGLSMQDLLESKLEGVQVTDISTFFERETGHVQLDSLNPSWMVYSDGFHQTSFRNVVKRTFDISASLILLLITLPVIIITAVLIVLESGFPVFYRQERVGECGQVFQVLKFRSMRQDAEKGGKPQWAAQNDNRVTRV
ncbi:MAG: sugar transferase, partial [Gammaproteobacteria bacterium]|nr:sugar transferase [Gammaproteobacteria bacterium]